MQVPHPTASTWQDAAAGLSREVIVFNWMPWFTANTDRLSFQSAGVGAELGRYLATNPGLRSLHVVGTSAGSFAADACCSAYVSTARAGAGGGDKQRNGDAGGDKQRAAVRLTLADPFAAREGASFQSGRGAQLFGRDADYNPNPTPYPYPYPYPGRGSRSRYTCGDGRLHLLAEHGGRGVAGG